MIVVIDGPAGSGKSSTARAVADRLHIEYLDSGALYRTATLLYIECEHDSEQFFQTLKSAAIRFTYRSGVFYVHLNDEDVTERIRSEDVADHVSTVAAMPRVRAAVNDLMRRVVKEGCYIAEGRDLGTAVFPDAELKFFMVADVKTRARRRYKEMQEQGIETTLERVEQNIRHRDKMDAGRKADPLKKADDAIEIDTSDKTFEQQVDLICSKIQSYLKHHDIEC